MKNLDFGNPVGESDLRWVYNALFEIQNSSRRNEQSDTDLADLQDRVTALESTNGAFHVHRAGVDQTGGTPLSYTLVDWTTKGTDLGTWFDLATDRYTPQSAGLYFFCLQVTTAIGASGDSTQAAIYLNGSAIALSDYVDASSSTGPTTRQVTCVVELNGTTDYVEGFCYLPDTITDISGDPTLTFLFGLRIGPAD